MKGSRATIMIGVSCLAASAAVILASHWMNEQADISTKRVVVAAADLTPGTPLAPGMLRVVDWPHDSVPDAAFSELSQLDARVTRTALLRGEPLLEAKLALPGATGGLSAVVAEGKRAMTVRVNDVIGVAGFALPGNYVDILVSTQRESDKDGERDQSVSKLVLERILVLAVAQEAHQSDTKPKVVNAVTLEVTPEQAEKLDLARSVGQLSLVLRNQIDLKSAQTTGATKETLLSLADAAAKPAAPAAGATAHPPAVRKKVEPRRSPARQQQCERVMTGAGPITQCF